MDTLPEACELLAGELWCKDEETSGDGLHPSSLCRPSMCKVWQGSNPINELCAFCHGLTQELCDEDVFVF